MSAFNIDILKVVDDGRRECPICSNAFHPQGIRAHMKSCSTREQNRRNMEEFQKGLNTADDSFLDDNSFLTERDDSLLADESVRLDLWAQPEMLASPIRPVVSIKAARKKTALSTSNLHDTPATASASSRSTVVPEKDTIKTEYHPNSNRNIKTKEEHFKDYQKYDEPKINITPIPEPWRPFSSKADFEFAEIAQDAHLSDVHVDRLLRLFRCCAEGKDKLNFHDSKSLKEAWLHACTQLPDFKHETLSVSHEGISGTYDIYSRSIWDWAMALLDDPFIAKEFEWDARRLYIFDGEKYERFIGEPWTADLWWEIQSKLPPGASPLFIVLNVDKTELSTFGAKKGYPVYAKFGNLPKELRDSQGYAGGRLVGWLPVLPEDPELSSKPEYVDFKRVVWHQSFKRFLDTIKEYSWHGFHKQCADGHGPRHLYPIILALSADFEEQSIISLTRGFMGKCPCPVCLVPDDLLHDQTVEGMPRTKAQTQSIIQVARKTVKESGIGAARAILKNYSLKDIDNAFWDLQFGDPHRLLAFDHMHNHPHGLGGKHLWPELKKRIEKIGKPQLKEVQNRAAAFPRWRDMHHFTDIISESFTDAKKLEDVVKIAPFISHSLFDASVSNDMGHLLLCCIRSYQILDAYIVMDIHTETTLEQGKKELLAYDKHLKQYISEAELEAEKDGTQKELKSWNFPKNHMHTHAFDDIRSKGTISLYTTMHFEPLHKPLKETVTLSTNFRNVDAQILRVDQERFVAQQIRHNINISEELVGQTGSSHPSAEGKVPAHTFNNIKLGSAQNIVSLDELLVKKHSNNLFNDFRSKLSSFLSTSLADKKLKADQLKAPGGTRITEFRMIRARYESRINWRESEDILRCNPDWKSGAREDCVMVDTHNGPIFGRLVFVFTMTIAAEQLPIALILPFAYAEPTSRTRQKNDTNLRLLRVRKPKDSKTEFIWARSIIRGALIVPSYDKQDDYIVFDLVDSDMVVRVQEIFERRRH